MSAKDENIDKDLLKRLYPINLITENLIGKLEEKLLILTISPEEVIVKHKKSRSNLYHYLVSGAAELRLSFVDRSVLESSDNRCCAPLEELIPQGGTIKALEPCEVLVANSDFIDQLLTWSQSQEFKVVHIENGDTSIAETTLIDDSFEEDWNAIFLQSDLAANIPAASMLQLFNQLEDIEVKDGERIVEQNTPGDYFYIIKKGFAKVLTDSDGPFAGVSFELSAGDYFGDEALIGDTIRNASIQMISDGVLGRLNSALFNQIIKSALVKTIANEETTNSQGRTTHYLDVRFPAEFKHNHQQQAENIPISHLRKKMAQLNSEDIYIISHEGGRRSELATYLLRQAGYEAYLGATNETQQNSA